jgi:cell wall-associated NlpC family hydrolase
VAAALTGCAHAPIDLGSIRPALHGSIGGLSIKGVFDGGDIRLTIDDAEEPTRGERHAWPHAAAGASAGRVLDLADQYVGIPYRYGGTSPTGGFDCSGFVQFVFRRNGVELPRTAREQGEAGRAAPRQATLLRPGDLMFFDGRGRGIDHVAIYVGRGRIIHASAGSGRVRYDDLDSSRGRWFLRHHVASRRILADHAGT